MAKKIKTVRSTDGYDYPITSYELVVDENGESVKDKLAAIGISTANGYKVYNVLDYNISTNNADNTPALQSLMNLVNENGGGTIFFPVGTYNFKPAETQESGTYAGEHKYAVLAKSNVSIVGENIENTILKCTEATPYSLFYRYVSNSDNPIHGCTYSNFTVDCYSTGNTNKVWGKVFFYQYVKDCVFRDLILKGTIATAMGIDYLDHVEINNVSCIDCGRTFVSESATTGTSGIGIGTGGWNNENFKITDCVCVGCGQYGIFIENQHTLGWGGNTNDPKGCIISNCITRNGLYRGIGVRGGTNVIVSNCNSYENAQEGIYLDNKCVNVKVSNNNVIGNKGNGILVKTNSDSVDIDINDNLIKGNSGYGTYLATNTNGLMLRHNITKSNTRGGLHSDNGLAHTDAVIRDNIFIDGEDTTNDLFTGITAYNDILKEENANITAITCDNFSVNVGATKTISYSVTPSYANKSKVTISTTDTDHITVDNDAKTVTGVAEGTATLTLEADGVTTTATVTVKSVSSSGSFNLTVENSEFILDTKLNGDGTTTANTGTGVTDYIDISSISTNIRIVISSFVEADGARICFYDENKTFISTTSLYSGISTAVDNYAVNLAKLPTYSYIRISINNLGSRYITISEADIIVVESSNILANTKLMPDGSSISENNSIATNYIDIQSFVGNGLSEVEISLDEGSSIRVCQYDSSKAPLSNNFDITSGKIRTVTLLENVAYLRVMVTNADASCIITLTF